MYNSLAKKVFSLHLFVTATNALNIQSTNALSRQKRYLVFPEGSSLSLALCMTAQAIMGTQIFTEAINWGVSYNLPNDTTEIRKFIGSKHVMQRRHRRDVYENMEIIMDSMGFNGRACIYRALCETARYVPADKSNLYEELIRLIFNFPRKQLSNSEPEAHRLYHWAYRMGLDKKDCSGFFPECSISLLDMAMEEYTFRPTN